MIESSVWCKVLRSLMQAGPPCPAATPKGPNKRSQVSSTNRAPGLYMVSASHLSVTWNMIHCGG
jgi:hypothetical protein